MRQVLTKIPLLPKLLSWGWQVINLRQTVTQMGETRARLEDLIQHIGALHHDVNVCKHELTVMKQDLSVVRLENEDLRGLGVLMSKLEAHDTALKELTIALADHRDATHKIHERLRREMVVRPTETSQQN